MTKISIFGKGNMGTAIGGNFEAAGHQVSYVQSDTPKSQLGEVVVFAVPYSAIESIISQYSDELSGKIVIDISNPVDFNTFDDLVVPADSSAASIIAEALPNSRVVKGFNTTFAATLLTKKVAGEHQTTVLLASDSQEAKETLTKILAGSGLAIIDAGALKRARELEALGFLQISLAASEKITWNGGFGIFD
ncbi:MULTISPECIES: NADPH-dependent F420 reductase [unclassified Enterococcus]|uniref:NADPH-dependent F420 reductase n=1 Tax=unclassified Enterococcus TaxID=2608891 RepID=UPI001555673D|nr:MULTISPECIES: NADPH-dependent F420 reductase [unclassified Enterococcus]MBS7576388.1 NADPH-dependent F420 reductase [Enterococcus sp. MMGLQ5-2]MBS7583620.1 NADPH-dependent F420 reductase [Enterococcus sp. MMGLQ5-1]NPD11481.1 NADPH-dependent F420 reductase [Enterococcus sp. MMGLQ5-1]NPD36225.1 NADPH-dependent F420 reductase [Enterococcus sp. MMGLQ5-2]